MWTFRSFLIVPIVATLVACGSTAATATPPATTAPQAQVSASTGEVPSTASPNPTLPSSATGSATTGPGPSSAFTNSHSNPDLESQLPSTVSGSTLTKFSLGLADLIANGGDRTTVDAFLASIGKSENDASVASAYDPSGKLAGGISAFRVVGADAGSLLAGIVALETSSLGSAATKTQSSVGGKSVTVLSIGTGANDTRWVYGHGDIVFVIQARDEATAASYLTVLP